MDRDLVFRLKAEPDTVQVAASLKQIGDQITAANLTITLKPVLPDFDVLQASLTASLANRPLVIPVMLNAIGMTGLPGGLPNATIGPTTQPTVAAGVNASALGGASMPPVTVPTVASAPPSWGSPVLVDAGTSGDAYSAFRGSGRDLENAKGKARESVEEINQAIDGINDRVNIQLRQGLYQTFEAVTRLGRGFAYIGAVGEQDVRKVLDVLMKVEATINLIRGGMDVVRGVGGAISTYQSGLAAIGGLQARAAGGVAGEVVEEGVEGVVGGVAGAGASAAVGRAGAARGLIGGASKIPLVAAGIAAVGGSIAGVNAIRETVIDANEYGFGGGYRPGRIGNTPANWIAQSGAWAQDQVASNELLEENIDGNEDQFRARRAPSWRRTLGSAMGWHLWDGPQDLMRLTQSNRRTASQEKMQSQRMTALSRRMLGNGIGNRESMQTLLANQQGESDFDELQLGAMSTGDQIERRRLADLDIESGSVALSQLGQRRRRTEATSIDEMGLLRGDALRNDASAQAIALSRVSGPVEVSEGLVRAAARNQSSTGDVRQQLELLRSQSGGELSSQDQGAMAGQIAEAEQKLVDLTKERQQIEKNISEERESGLRRSVSGLQDLVRTSEEMATSIRESMAANQERIGMMDQSQIFTLKSAATRMQKITELEKGGPEEQAKALEMRRAFSREDLSLLGGTGQVGQDFVSTEARRRYKESGVGDLGLDAAEREKADAASAGGSRARAALATRVGELDAQTAANREAGAGGRIEVELRDNRTLELTIKRDDEEMIDRAVSGLKSELDRRDAAMLARITAQFDQERNRLANTTNQQAAAAALGRNTGAR